MSGFRGGIYARLVIPLVMIAGCAKGPQPEGTDAAASRPQAAVLSVPQHSGARAGNVPVHVGHVEVDGQRYDLKNGDRTIDLPPVRHEVSVSYDRCFHGPTQLMPEGASRAMPTVSGLVAFDAEPGGRYVLGCTAGGVGAMIANAHWVDQQLPNGKRRRVADAKAGSDFPTELLGAEPPLPMRSPGTPIAPR